MPLKQALKDYTAVIIARNNQDDIEAAVERLEAAIVAVLEAAMASSVPAPPPSPPTNPLADALG